MFNLSECVIKFQNSSAWRRFMMVLNGIALLLVFSSGLPVWTKVILGFWILIASFHVFRYPKPYPAYDVLTIRAGSCVLFRTNNTPQEYTHCRVLVNCGLFFLLELSAEKSKRILVIFFDQIEMDCYRTICFLEKIQ